MLAYAFRALEKGTYERLGSEEFDNAQELCAAILTRGVESQIKRGLGRGYVPQAEALSCVRGKIDISASLKTNSLLKRQLVCSYDELSTDTQANRIVKAAMQVLLRSRDISSARKRDLRRLLPYLAGAGEADLHRCDWNVRINRNNQDYRLLLFVCRLVRDGDYLMSGNPIGIRSLDLSREFEDVRRQLDAVAEKAFGSVAV